jgi:hypothetical protein
MNFFKYNSENNEKNDEDLLKEIIDDNNEENWLLEGEQKKIQIKNIFLFQFPNQFVLGTMFITDFRIEFITKEKQVKSFNNKLI